MFHQILVPLDGSTLAERVIPHAEQFARIFGSCITYLQILDPTTFHEGTNPVDPLSWQIRKAETEKYLQGIVEATRVNLGDKPAEDTDIPGGRVGYAIQEGKTAENIINFAHNQNMDLLVIGSHGASGLSGWNLSSITQKVIDRIYLPVLIVRTYHPCNLTNDRLHYRRILLPIDSSRRAECSLFAGVALAAGGEPAYAEPGQIAANNHTHVSALPVARSTLVLAAVLKPPELPMPEPYPIEIERLSHDLMGASREAVKAYLDGMQGRLPVDCETCILEDISVASAIQRLANEKEDIDLVVLCAHGNTGDFSWPYGSVTRNYIDHGIKTVLVIQDIPRSQVKPTAAEMAAEKSGRR